jgi:hypothetical protein
MLKHPGKIREIHRSCEGWANTKIATIVENKIAIAASAIFAARLGRGIVRTLAAERRAVKVPLS